MEESQYLNDAKLAIDMALKNLRVERDQRPSNTLGTDGKRELSVALTKLEEAGMWVNRSIYCATPYSPINTK